MRKINKINSVAIAIVGIGGIGYFIASNNQPTIFIISLIAYLFVSRTIIIKRFYLEESYCEKCGEILLKGKTSNFFTPFKESPLCGFKLKLDDENDLIP